MTEEYLEKKSEEYVPNIKWHDFSSEDLREEMKLCYREGMKDGYQEGLKAKINATTISDCPVKDKWHYPAKGDLPKEHRKRYLIATPGLIVGAETRTNLGKDIVFVNDFGTFERASEVIAWRELPEPPKEEE